MIENDKREMLLHEFEKFVREYNPCCTDYNQDMLEAVLDLLKEQDEKCHACGEKTNNAIQSLQAELKSQEPQVIAIEEACGRDYCFYEYRAAGYIEPASVVMSGLLLNDSEPLVEVFRIGREGPAYVAMKDYGHEWRCWDRMPEDGQKEGEPWD